MTPKNILVTGAAGFIGSHIVDALTKRGHYVVGIDNLSGGEVSNIETPFSRNGLQLMDCANVAGLTPVFETGLFDTVVHCAANAREGASQFQPYSVTHNNAHAYAAVLSTAIRFGVQNVICFSSMAVYGRQTPPFTEETPMRPVDVYGCNKCLMEQMTSILASVHGFSYVIIRPHNVFGERQRMTDKFRNVVAIMMNRILRGEPIFIYGDGEQTRAFSYIDDSLPSFIRAIENCGEDGLRDTTINIGGQQAISINALARVIMHAMGAVADYPIEFYVDRPLEVKHAFTSYEKSQRLLQYAENTGWEQGVYAMAKWAIQQGPKDWVNNEPLEIITDKTPIPWLT